MYVGGIDLITDQAFLAANEQGAAVRLPAGMSLPVPAVARSRVIDVRRIRERVAALSASRTFGRVRPTSRALNGVSAAASLTFLMLVGDLTSPLPWLTGTLALATAAGAGKVR